MCWPRRRLIQKQAEEHARDGRRHAARGRHRQGHHPCHHRQDRHGGRHRPRHRIRGRGDPRAFDGRPHDGLQHVHRGRRTRRHDRAGRERPSIISRAAARAQGAAWDMALAVLASLPRDDGADSTARSRSTPPRCADVTWGTSPEDVAASPEPCRIRPIAEREARRRGARAGLHGP